jgi:flagellar hook-associated protein 1 FlgK
VENFGLPSVTTSTDLTQVTTNSKTGGFTIDSYFKDAISKLGVDSQQAQKMVTNQGALLAQLETRRESISGVSTDEEMINMVKYQHAYTAASRVITVIDEMLDTLINRTGAAGR